MSEFLAGEEGFPDQRLVTDAEIVVNAIRTAPQVEGFQKLPDTTVIQIPRQLIPEVPHQLVVVAQLADSGPGEQDGPAVGPGDTLGHQASPC